MENYDTAIHDIGIIALLLIIAIAFLDFAFVMSKPASPDVEDED